MQQNVFINLNYRFIDNEIPHLNPSDGCANKRYYKNLNNKYYLTEAEREKFECTELFCGKLLKKYNSGDSDLRK